MLYKKFNESTKQAHKPLLISGEKWKSILDHLVDKKSIQSAQEEKYYEYLKNGSKNMTKNWTNTIATSIEQAKSKKNQYEERIQEDLRLFDKIKEQDDKIRKEKIEKADRMLHKLLAGPRELESAAMHCEILKGRQIQIEFGKKIKEIKKEDKIRENKEFEEQAVPYIQELQNRMKQDIERKKKYKKELIETIKKNNESNTECKKLKFEGERKILELMRQDLELYQNQEKCIEISKKNLFREQILEDILNKQRKCNRMNIEDQIDDKLNRAYTEKQEKLRVVAKAKQKKEICERMCFIEKNAKKNIKDPNEITKIEEHNRLKKVEEEERKYQAKQKEKEEKEQQLREDRIRDHEKYLKYKQKLDQEQREMFRWDLANRLKNVEVYEDFLKQQKLNKIEKLKQTQKTLTGQMKEQKAIQSYEKVMDTKCNTVNYDLQDKFFLDYANQLIEDAKKKNRPILPLQKAVASYKKKHELDRKVVVPIHLRTNIVMSNE